MGKTLLQKVWDLHSVRTLPTGQTQLFIGLHLVHEVTSPQAFDVLRARGWKVARLDRTFATVDHIVPRSRGGDTSWTNVVAACLRCNLRKGNRLPHEVGMRLAREPVHPKFLFSTHMLRHPHASSLLDSWRKYLVAVPTPS